MLPHTRCGGQNTKDTQCYTPLIVNMSFKSIKYDSGEIYLNDQARCMPNISLDSVFEILEHQDREKREGPSSSVAFAMAAPWPAPCPGLRYPADTVYYVDTNALLRLLSGEVAFPDAGGQRDVVQSLLNAGLPRAGVLFGVPACSGLLFVQCKWFKEAVTGLWCPWTFKVPEPVGLTVPTPVFDWGPSVQPRVPNAPPVSPWEYVPPPGGGAGSAGPAQGGGNAAGTSSGGGSAGLSAGTYTAWGFQPGQGPGGGNTAGPPAGGMPWGPQSSSSSSPPQPKARPFAARGQDDAPNVKDIRKGQPVSPITVYKNFSDHVYWEIPERIAWGLWACENGIAVSWVCSMSYDQFMTKDCTLLFAGLKKLKIG